MEMLKHSEIVEEWLPGIEHDPADYDIPCDGASDDYTSDAASKCLDYLLYIMPPSGTC